MREGGQENKATSALELKIYTLLLFESTQEKN